MYVNRRKRTGIKDKWLNCLPTVNNPTTTYKNVNDCYSQAMALFLINMLLMAK